MRVYLLSDVKPYTATYREGRAIGHSSESDICVNNGLRFCYFDGICERFLSVFDLSMFCLDLCTLKLPMRSKALSRFLVCDHWQPAGETSNEVIVSQFACLDHMSLGEYKALAAILFGYCI